MSQSKAFDLFGIVKALVFATEFIRGDLRAWQPAQALETGRRQDELLRRLEAIDRELARIPELKAWASLSVLEINDILGREGFEIRLTPWPPDGRSFGVVAILDVIVEWLASGDGTKKIHRRHPDGGHDYDRPAFPAFELSTREHGVDFLEVPGSDETVVRVLTKIRRRGLDPRDASHGT